MKFLRKYIISGIAITIGCLLIYVFYDPVLGLCMISLTFFFISVKSTKWREPIEFKRPKWNPVSFYKGGRGTLWHLSHIDSIYLCFQGDY